MAEDTATNGASNTTPDEANETPLTLSALTEALKAQDEKWQQRFNAQDAAFKKRLKKASEPTQVPQQSDDDDGNGESEDPVAAVQKQLAELQDQQQQMRLDTLFDESVKSVAGLTPNAGPLLRALLRPQVRPDGLIDVDGDEVSIRDAIAATLKTHTELVLPENTVQQSNGGPTAPTRTAASPKQNKGATEFDPKNAMGMIGNYFADQAGAEAKQSEGTVM